MEFQAHEVRVVQERNELNTKIESLTTFLNGSVYKTLSSREQSLLSTQLQHMLNYRNTLNERIGGFVK